MTLLHGTELNRPRRGVDWDEDFLWRASAAPTRTRPARPAEPATASASGHGGVLLTFRAPGASIGVWDVRGTQPDRARPSAPVDYERVFRDAAPDLWRTIYAFAAGRRAVADDAVAEAFARALAHAGQIRDPVPWLYRTAFRLAAADLRRERRGQELDLDLEPDHSAASTAGLAGLVPALRQLSPAERAAVVLHYEADLPVREVALRMGTSAGAVRVHLFRGRRRLRELLGSEEVDDA